MAWDWQSINWASLIVTTLSTGILTALGAGIGAYWGGKPLVKYAQYAELNSKKESLVKNLNNFNRMIINETGFIISWGLECYQNDKKIIEFKDGSAQEIHDTEDMLYSYLSNIKSLILPHFKHLKKDFILLNDCFEEYYYLFLYISELEIYNEAYIMDLNQLAERKEQLKKIIRRIEVNISQV